MAPLRRLRAAVDRLLALRAARGPYRFLVRQWGAVSDLDLALRVLSTDFFREELTPLPLPVAEAESILLLAPHQDDETIGAGGTLLLAARAGVRLDILYVTDGAPEKPSFAATPEEAARVRDAEAREVCERLGARMHRLGISNHRPRPTAAEVDRLAGLIHELRPRVLLTPWLLDRPAKHRLVNHLLWLANRRRPLPECEVWGYQVHNDLLPNGYVDITEVAEEKRRLLECFRSQNEHDRRYDHQAMGLAAWNARLIQSTEPRYLEVFFTLPLREMLALVERFYFTDLEATYRGHPEVLAAARALQEQVAGKCGWKW